MGAPGAKPCQAVDEKSTATKSLAIEPGYLSQSFGVLAREKKFILHNDFY